MSFHSLAIGFHSPDAFCFSVVAVPLCSVAARVSAVCRAWPRLQSLPRSAATWSAQAA